MKEFLSAVFLEQHHLDTPLEDILVTCLCLEQFFSGRQLECEIECLWACARTQGSSF